MIFAELFAACGLLEKLPKAVGWEFTGPYRLSFPDEIMKASGAKTESQHTMAGLMIHNYAGTTRSEIRVLYSGSVDYKPKISCGRRSVPVKREHNEIEREFVFFEAPLMKG